MLHHPPMLDRAILQPLDIGEANRHWRREYNADALLFHFGSGHYSRTEKLGYFLDAEGRVEAYLRGGKEVGKWSSLREFFAEELNRLEPIYAESEKQSEQFRAELEMFEKSKRGARTKTARKANSYC
jgi:hypothetical protein